MTGATKPFSRKNATLAIATQAKAHHAAAKKPKRAASPPGGILSELSAHGAPDKHAPSAKD